MACCLNPLFGLHGERARGAVSRVTPSCLGLEWVCLWEYITRQPPCFEGCGIRFCCSDSGRRTRLVDSPCFVSRSVQIGYRAGVSASHAFPVSVTGCSQRGIDCKGILAWRYSSWGLLVLLIPFGVLTMGQIRALRPLLERTIPSSVMSGTTAQEVSGSDQTGRARRRGGMLIPRE